MQDLQVLTSLRKRTKSGLSVWNFCRVPETDQYFAVGGEDMRVIAATDRKHLKQIHENFKRYGYKVELPVLRKKQVINDPWASDLPAQMQMELEALASV